MPEILLVGLELLSEDQDRPSRQTVVIEINYLKIS